MGRPGSSVWLQISGGLAIFALAGCPSEPVAPEAPVEDAHPDGPGFVDGAGLRDGTVTRFDAARPPPDATPLTPEGGICRIGSVSGLVCAPNGASFINEAVISAVSRGCDGVRRVVTTRSNAVGRFRLEGLAPGPTLVTIRAGSFAANFDVEVQADRDVPVAGISNKVCLASSAAHIAVLSGDYDRIQQVLDGLGFEYDLYCGESRHHRPARALLLDWGRLSAYDLLFVNCTSGINLRSTNPETLAIVANLRRFVAEGGSIYASDLAADFVETPWPELVDFRFNPPGTAALDPCCACGGDCPDECRIDPPTPPERCANCCRAPNDLPEACRRGTGLSGTGARRRVVGLITADFLRAYLPEPLFPIEFNLGGWVNIASVREGPEVEVLVEGQGGDLAGQPLMVLLQPDPAVEGRIAYTSFHNHNQATAEMLRLLEGLIFRL